MSQRVSGLSPQPFLFLDHAHVITTFPDREMYAAFRDVTSHPPEGQPPAPPSLGLTPLRTRFSMYPRAEPRLHLGLASFSLTSPTLHRKFSRNSSATPSQSSSPYRSLPTSAADSIRTKEALLSPIASQRETPEKEGGQPYPEAVTPDSIARGSGPTAAEGTRPSRTGVPIPPRLNLPKTTALGEEVAPEEAVPDPVRGMLEDYLSELPDPAEDRMPSILYLHRFEDTLLTALIDPSHESTAVRWSEPVGRGL